jgi:hypothetical protein
MRGQFGAARVFGFDRTISGLNRLRKRAEQRLENEKTYLRG